MRVQRHIKTRQRLFLGCIKKQLPADAIGQTIIFYEDETLKENILRYAPTSEIYLVKVAAYQPELILQELELHFRKHPAQILLFPANFAGAELCVRLAYRLNGSSLIGVDQIEQSQNGFICSKDVYSSNLQASIELTAPPFCISLKNGAVDPLAIPENLLHQVVEKDISQESVDFVKKSTFISNEETNKLNSAKFVLAVGQGVASKQAVHKMELIAEKLNAQLVVSRPVAMQAWAPLDRMVGISGTITNPELCLAIGASGAAAFMAGIEKSRFIISINSDPQAAIINQSDVAVIADYQAFIDKLMKVIPVSK